ncbi:MAG: aminotransferase class III-fold pyridoxal phosphate-dependent enzyme [Rhodobacteraceae bacterium]|nr:aminotransferase class III-fold pyridoxal phosphate-dependent enzyme [Paracoccaceae bacterium]
MRDQPNNSDIKFLDRNPPRFSVSEARRIAQKLFDLTGYFTPLDSERDQNFRIHTQQGHGYVLKFSNVDEEPGVIDFQTQALLHIEQQDPALPVPRVVRTRDGAAFEIVKASRGTQHIVYVLTYLPGVILDDVAQTPTLWRNLGRQIARLDLALRGFFHPHARHDLLWDLLRCTDLRPHTVHIADTAARQNIEAVLDHMAVEIMPRLKRLRHQVIHADAHSNNTLTHPQQPDTITGILDFGDMVYAPLVAEVAIAADVDGLPPDELIDTLCHLVAGFDSVVPLEEEEIDLVYDLVLARLAATATIIAWRKVMTPNRPAYLHDVEVSYWETIARLINIGRATIRDSLRTACRFPPYCPLNGASDVSDDTEHLLARRYHVLGTKLSLFYSQPLHIERGRGPWLYNAQGKAYLDAYNNVPVVGHCHPHVVKAIARQMAALNTNTRYLYRSILDYAERLTGLLPGNLSVCVFVNSGSEANDVAWRIAQFITGQRGALVMEDAYHGITETTAHLSTYDLRRGLAPHVQTLMSPDPYRGVYRHGEPHLAERYAADAERAIADLAKAGLKPAAFMIDTTFLSNGVPDVPAGYVAAVTAKVRAGGGLLIADEVQAGFGRFGTHMWGHLAHDVIPDIVTLGKPVGNGYPLGIVVTTPDILNAFVEETGLFSTYGGNPVACAAGMAVLDVIENEGLLANARVTGDYLREGLRGLMSRHTWLGDVRGWGLLAGIELVRDRTTREPADTETKRLLDLMRDNGVLIGCEGPFDNVLKIRPPLVFKRNHADILIEALDRSLAAL